MTGLLASRSFSLDDQTSFARLSSDFNPIHLDQNFARRTQAGAPIVHGIHTLLWAANAALMAFPIGIANIVTRFPQPLYLDEVASVRLKSRTERQIDVEVVAANTVVALIKLSSIPGKTTSQREVTLNAPRQLSQPANPAFADLAGQTGAAAIIGTDIADLFPDLAKAIGTAGIKALLATSQIVGMQCPGLHSLFAGLNINFNQDGADQGEALAYTVGKIDSRFRSVQINVAGYGTTGRLEAFARLPPPSQAGMQEVLTRVSGRPFAGQRSLVVGGSRGLGAVTARIIAAGGGHPIITYRDSRDEADDVAGDIRGAGGSCDVLRYDALSPAADQLKAMQPVDCCYYFATPKIFLRKSGLFEADRLRSFLGFYADGFFDLCTALVRDRTDALAMFYPSTVAIEQGPDTTAEYAMAKSAGETLARYLNAFVPHIDILCRRLPRILTDQTATVGVASADNALDVMLAVVSEVQQMARHEPSTSV